MFSQAMKGNHQMALEYANKVIEVIHNAYRFEDRIESLEKNEKFVKREGAMVLRLMGNYADALKEFNDLLARGEDYWGLF
jgi:tetratricopeptide (TPR) repeat protein